MYDPNNNDLQNSNKTKHATQEGRGMMEAIPDYFILDPESSLYTVYMPDRLLKAYGIWIACESVSIILSSLLVPLSYRIKQTQTKHEKYIELE